MKTPEEIAKTILQKFDEDEGDFFIHFSSLESDIAQAIRAEREARLPSREEFKQWAEDKESWSHGGDPSALHCYEWIRARMAQSAPSASDNLNEYFKNAAMYGSSAIKIERISPLDMMNDTKDGPFNRCGEARRAWIKKWLDEYDLGVGHALGAYTLWLQKNMEPLTPIGNKEPENEEIVPSGNKSPSESAQERTLEDLSEEHVKNWPKKSNWDDTTRYDTMMRFEIRDEKQESFEAGYRAKQNKLKNLPFFAKPLSFDYTTEYGGDASTREAFIAGYQAALEEK